MVYHRARYCHHFCSVFTSALDLPLAPQVCNLESDVDDSKIFLSFPIKDAESAERVLEEDCCLVLGVVKINY